MRIALIGAAGQLGTDIASLLGERVVPLSRRQADVTQPERLEAVLDDVQPDLVINAAAYNQVDRAESEPVAAFAVNADGPRNLAVWCARHRARLVHVSSDYVFGQEATRATPYVETDAVGPINVYGRSKAAGETNVLAECQRAFVVRTCGLYGHAAKARGTRNFVETILRLAQKGAELRVVDDQDCTPTASADLARAIAALIETDAFGIYHATNAGRTTWHGFACEIVGQAGLHVPVVPITTEQWGAPAPRPRFSVLNTCKLAGTIGLELPDWSEALASYLAQRPGVTHDHAL